MSGRNGAGAESVSKEMKDPRQSAGSTKGPGLVVVGNAVVAIWETLRKISRSRSIRSVGCRQSSRAKT
jgi:hypothetical protein